MDAAEIIRQTRSRAGMTQAQLAEAAGTSQPAIAAYESGSKSPSVRTLDRIVRTARGTLRVTLGRAPRAQGDLLSELRAQRRRIEAAAVRNRVRNVRIFGSAARGEETAQSDVDLLVDVDIARHGVLPLVAFARDVRGIIGRDVDATTVELLRDDVRAQALVEAVPL